jgi:signal-transduction protein with cAMP-binding, CBS, and nucleotidyltransferase domain
MDRAVIERIDSFIYRHRVGEAMSSPVATILPADTLQTAARAMQVSQVSALVAVDQSGRPTGIMTEHDVLRAVAADGAAALTRPVGGLLAHPVVTVTPEDFLHVAIARMNSRRIRHLCVVERGSGRAVGIIVARALLRQRADSALALGEDIATAGDADALARTYRRLPVVARGLLSEGLSAAEIAEVISDALRDITARAAGLAEQAMREEGQGEAPAAWAFLVLGSAGRGESLLAADQDNALVHAGAESDDAWYAELGRRAADIMNSAGLVYCSGGVMAKNKNCRHSLAGWESEIDRWVRESEPIDLLNADIFYDFRDVLGDGGLAAELRRHAQAAARSPSFLMRLAHRLEIRSPALSPVFGSFRAKAGRVDLKQGGSRTLVAAARILALKIGSAALSTSQRLAAATEAGLLQIDDLALFRDAHERLQRLILEQQLIDIEAGRKPGATIEVRRLPRIERERLKATLTAISRLDLVVRDALSR